MLHELGSACTTITPSRDNIHNACKLQSHTSHVQVVTSGAFTEKNTSLQRPEPKHPSKDRQQQHTTSQTTSHALYSPNCLQQATTAKRWGFNSLPPSQHRSCTAKPRQRRKSAAQCKVTKTARKDVQKAHCDQKTACYSRPLPTEKKKWRQKKENKLNKTSMHNQTSHSRAMSVSLRHKNFAKTGIVKDSPFITTYWPGLCKCSNMTPQARARNRSPLQSEADGQHRFQQKEKQLQKV